MIKIYHHLKENIMSRIILAMGYYDYYCCFVVLCKNIREKSSNYYGTDVPQLDAVVKRNSSIMYK